MDNESLPQDAGSPTLPPVADPSLVRRGKHLLVTALATVGALLLALIALGWTVLHQTSRMADLNVVVAGQATAQEASKKLTDLEAKLNELQLTLFTIRLSQYSPIDLTITSSQRMALDQPFLVNVKEVTQQLTGIKIIGKIVNTSAITYAKTTFKVSCGESENTFEIIPDLLPGFSRSFSIYIPDVKPEEAKTAHFSFVNATIMFR